MLRDGTEHLSCVVYNGQMIQMLLLHLLKNRKCIFYLTSKDSDPNWDHYGGDRVFKQGLS